MKNQGEITDAHTNEIWQRLPFEDEIYDTTLTCGGYLSGVGVISRDLQLEGGGHETEHISWLSKNAGPLGPWISKFSWTPLITHYTIRQWKGQMSPQISLGGPAYPYEYVYLCSRISTMTVISCPHPRNPRVTFKNKLGKLCCRMLLMLFVLTLNTVRPFPHSFFS